MSNPPTSTTPPPPAALPSPYHHLQPPYNLPSTTPTATPMNREYRKGNWTIQETLTLITAKKIDDERRSRGSSSSSASSSRSPSSKPVELKWKWVENYCWSHGCFRSQNQCNDKWDNLLRDYKKVREYQSRSNGSDQSQFPSYFSLERTQRKERNLPSNMAQEIYHALYEVVQRRFTKEPSSSRPVMSIAPLPTQTVIPPPPIPPPADVSDESDSSGTESSEKLQETSDIQTKSKKLRKIGSSMVKGASVLAQTLNSGEEKKEKRHQEIMQLENRRLEIEEARNEVNQLGISNLVGAMTNLSGAIQSFMTSYYDQT
ncbi:uncharacterized protein [Rutidosis leptorrhynchoides]|uniref:uncharacterized protein n=1 Tax=Rutidosis leptorrhynchoides TaxID=125765 RepID=UPI003A9A5C56